MCTPKRNTHPHTHLRVHTHTHTHARPHARTRAHTHKRAAQACKCAHTHTHTQACTHMRMPTCTHTCTHICTHMHMHIHAQTHAQVRACTYTLAHQKPGALSDMCRRFRGSPIQALVCSTTDSLCLTACPSSEFLIAMQPAIACMRRPMVSAARHLQCRASPACHPL